MATVEEVATEAGYEKLAELQQELLVEIEDATSLAVSPATALALTQTFIVELNNATRACWDSAASDFVLQYVRPESAIRKVLVLAASNLPAQVRSEMRRVLTVLSLAAEDRCAGSQLRRSGRVDDALIFEKRSEALFSASAVCKIPCRLGR